MARRFDLFLRRYVLRPLFGPRVIPADESDPGEHWERERLEALDDELELEGKPPVEDDEPSARNSIPAWNRKNTTL